MGNRVSRIGLVGMGRVGRNLFRLLYDSDDLKLAAVSDRSDPAALAYLLRFDTLMGRFPAPVSAGDPGGGTPSLDVAGLSVGVHPAKPAGEIPWGELGVDTVIETADAPRSRADLDRHLAAGARRVIVCSSAVDRPDVTVVAGVNDDDLRAEHRIVSHASPSVHAVAPVTKVLHEAFGIRRAFLSTVHAYTERQRLADVPAADARDGRAAAASIIPHVTDDAGVLAQLLPFLRDKVSGMGISVPVANGSAADLVCWHDRPVTVDEVNRAVRDAASRSAGVLAYEDAPIASSDILLSPSSGTLDSLATMVLVGNVSKTLTWFDNSWGYTHRLLDLLRRLQALDAAGTPAADEAKEAAR
jgi:glyceraldehyde 3-phosphate dehydrogenase